MNNDEEKNQLQALNGANGRPNSPWNKPYERPPFRIARHGTMPVLILLFSAMILGSLALGYHFGKDVTKESTHQGIADTEEPSSYTPKCQLLPSNEGPLPVIIMAVGRTGSSITWNTIARMTSFPNIAEEITGGNVNKTIEFFDNIDPEVGVHWASETVCEEQHRVRRAMKGERGIGIAGFQWKPYRPSLRHEFGDGAFHEIAAHSNPSIRIIFLTRNPLDRLLSNLKHKQYINSEEVPPHCAIDDTDCIKRHYQHETAIVLPTGQELRRTLEQGLILDEMVADKLSFSGVKHIHVTYEKLYSTDNAEEWQRIFKFLGRGPHQTTLTMSDVQQNFDLAPTSSKSHKDIIANFDDVWKSLKGTKYESLMH